MSNGEFGKKIQEARSDWLERLADSDLSTDFDSEMGNSEVVEVFGEVGRASLLPAKTAYAIAGVLVGTLTTSIGFATALGGKKITDEITKDFPKKQ